MTHPPSLLGLFDVFFDLLIQRIHSLFNFSETIERIWFQYRITTKDIVNNIPINIDTYHQT